MPDGDLIGPKRRRLEMRLTRLTQLFGWGELTGEDYRRQMTETRAMLAASDSVKWTHPGAE